MNRELPDVQAGFRKGRRTTDQWQHSLNEKKQENPQKISTSVSLTMLKLLSVIHNKLWKTIQEMWIPDRLTCLLRNLYASWEILRNMYEKSVGQEATVRTGHGTTDLFQIGKGVHQGCVLSPCLFNLYAEYIMWNAGLNEAQAGIKIARRNINNLSYADEPPFWQKAKKN